MASTLHQTCCRGSYFMFFNIPLSILTDAVPTLIAWFICSICRFYLALIHLSFQNRNLHWYWCLALVNHGFLKQTIIWRPVIGVNIVLFSRYLKKTNSVRSKIYCYICICIWDVPKQKQNTVKMQFKNICLKWKMLIKWIFIKDQNTITKYQLIYHCMCM